jgi:hypothetical protein
VPRPVLALSLVLALTLPLATQEEAKPEKLQPAGGLAGTQGAHGQGEVGWGGLVPAAGPRPAGGPGVPRRREGAAGPAPQEVRRQGATPEVHARRAEGPQGPGNLPGYAATPDDLRTGQAVALTRG